MSIVVYKNVKIYQVDGTNKLLKKYDVKTINGVLEISFFNELDEVHLILTTENEQNEQESIYYDIKLSDLNFDFKNLENLLELKRQDNQKKYFAVKLSNPDERQRLKETLIYLQDIYVAKKSSSACASNASIEYDNDSINDVVTPKGFKIRFLIICLNKNFNIIIA